MTGVQTCALPICFPVTISFLECRSLLTLDIDKYQGDIGALEFDLDLSGWGAFVAYSTHRHTADMPRVRIVMPLSREVSGDEYRALSQRFVIVTESKKSPCAM